MHFQFSVSIPSQVILSVLFLFIATSATTPIILSQIESEIDPSMTSSISSFRKISASKLYVSRPTDWLESRFHFSFAEYHNPKNERFGVLRVMNDDIVQPHEGFDTHPHRNMEIVSYIVDGELTHQDSFGHKETLGRGCVQYMSAGKGIYHSEMNEGDKPVRFIQIWIVPDKMGITPAYGSRVFTQDQRHNKIQHIISNHAVAESNPELIGFHQDSNLYVSELEEGKEVEFHVKSARQTYLLCIEGKVEVSGAGLSESLEQRDAMEIRGEVELKLKAPNNSKAHLLMIEMKM